MAIYAVTFRIAQKWSILGTYQERYDSFVERVQLEGTGTYWVETTSFILLNADHTNSQSLAADIANNSRIDPAMDLAVVINLSAKGYTVIGDNEDDDLELLMSLR